MLQCCKEIASITILEMMIEKRNDNREGWKASYVLLYGCPVGANKFQTEMARRCKHDVSPGSAHMRQSVPFPWAIVPRGMTDFTHSTKAKYFYKDVVWESVDHDCGSICDQ